MKKLTSKGNKVMTTAELTDIVLEMREEQHDVSRKIDLILAAMKGSPVVETTEEPPVAEEAPKSPDFDFKEDFLVARAKMSPEERKALRDKNAEEYHAWYDPKWEEWSHQRDDVLKLKGDARSAANRAKNQELQKEWRAYKKSLRK